MIHDITFDGKRYDIETDDSTVSSIDVKEDTVNVCNENLQSVDDMINDLPDFNFNDAEKYDVIYTSLQGRVIDINVKNGQHVKKGDVLAVLESMKMEIQISAPADCYIKKISIRVGDFIKVNSEAFIIDFVN